MSPCCTSCGHTRETTRLINYIAKLQCTKWLFAEAAAAALCVCACVSRDSLEFSLGRSVPLYRFSVLLNVSRDALCDLPRVMKQLNMFDIFPKLLLCTQQVDEAVKRLNLITILRYLEGSLSQESHLSSSLF